MEVADDQVVVKFMSDEEQLAELCEKLDRRGAEIDWQEAHLWLVQAESKWQAKKDFDITAELNRAEERLIKLFMEGAPNRVIMGKAWSEYRKALFTPMYWLC